MRKVFLWSMVGSLVAAALLGVGALVLPGPGMQWEIFGSVMLLAAFSLIALMCAAVLERRRLVIPMRIGLAATVGALAVWLVLIWFSSGLGWRAGERLARAAVTLTIAAALAAQSGLLMLPRLHRPRTRRVRTLTVGLSIALAAYGLLLTWAWDWLEGPLDDDMLLRCLGILAVLAACGTGVTPILWKVEATAHDHEAGALPGRLDVRLACPRCGSEQTLRTGPDRCADCGLKITIEVEEPRCACGYLLHRLTSDHCPECGREVPLRDRWTPPAPRAAA